MNRGGIPNHVGSGGQRNLTFFVPTGNPFTVYLNKTGVSDGFYMWPDYVARFFQNFTPDARFVQFALKYEF